MSSKISKPSPNKRQGSLFSFFTKKSPGEKASKPTPTVSKPSPPKIKINPLVAQIEIGTRVSVFWPDDSEYYSATVKKRKGASTTFTLLYDDDEIETVDLSKEDFKILGCVNPKNPKKRRIVEEEEEEDDEAEHDLGDESDGSEFISGQEEEEEEEDTTWMSMDEEEEEEEKPRSFKRLKVVPVTSTEPSPSKFKIRQSITPSPNREVDKKETYSANASNKPQQIKSEVFLTPPMRSNATDFTSFTAKKSNTPNKTAMSQNSSQVVNNAITPMPTSAISPPKFIEKVVNPKGSHVHNHLPFLMVSHDDKQIPHTDPRSNPRTLTVNYGHLEKVTGSKVSPAQVQWWEIKKHYFDTVLLFKVGKFYEMFHMDADVGTEVLGFDYMKGIAAHSGCPEAAYGTIIRKLTQAGKKVARVEQTETQTAFQLRKKETRGKKPQVTNREVCGVVSQGTRTMNFMDGSGNEAGPLLSIREDGDRYGVTVIDTVRSVVTMGEFSDDLLRSRMRTLLQTFQPAEILISNKASRDLKMLIHSVCPLARVEVVKKEEDFPPSKALDSKVRKELERPSPVSPWDAEETVQEFHRCHYFPRGSKKNLSDESISRWPEVLQTCVEGSALLALSALGSSLFYLQRSLIAREVFRMRNFKAYIPPGTEDDHEQLSQICEQDYAKEDGIDRCPNTDQITHMQVDGTTLQNLEILTNLHDNTTTGTLWQQLNTTVTPHGCRLLRAWLLRPLFQKSDIDRRADAVSALATDSDVRMAMESARPFLSKCNDLERLLSRIHSMSISEPADPNSRAVLYEGVKYTKRKVEDFSKVLHGLKHVCRVMECFAEVQTSGLLHKVVTSLPGDTEEKLNWFFENFDLEKAAKGKFEPCIGIDENYDNAVEEIDDIKQQLEDYREEMCAKLSCRSTWKYINVKDDSKDKYLIELPTTVRVPADFIVKAKRGKGSKQINKYSTSVVERLVKSFEISLNKQTDAKSRGMQLIFAKFDELRALWATASQVAAMLDALNAMANLSSQPGYSRPKIIDEGNPCIRIQEGRHPCVDFTHSGGEFIPNDLNLGCPERILLLSGPNMGGKSTLLRQTCLVAILSQIGCFVPAGYAELTPLDRIFTRIGASDSILTGQSTFFVELAECAMALKHSSRRSLVIMDELGRGTSTFDGTAIAHATIQHLLEDNRCLAMFATHYHSLLQDYKHQPDIRLGHMDCLVETDGDKEDITFLYRLADGACKKSFGIHVAKLANLPQEVWKKAIDVSEGFEEELSLRKEVDAAVERDDWEEAQRLWEKVGLR